MLELYQNDTFLPVASAAIAKLNALFLRSSLSATNIQWLAVQPDEYSAPPIVFIETISVEPSVNTLSTVSGGDQALLRTFEEINSAQTPKINFFN